MRLSPLDPSAATVRARFGRQGAETAIAVDSEVHALTLPPGTACLELENTIAVPPGASPGAVEQATATVAVEVRTTGSAPPPASADEKILLDARHSTTQGSFCIRLPEGVLSAATSLDRALPNNDYDVYSIRTRPASKINMQAAVTDLQQPPATTIATVRQGTYCGEAVRSFSDSAGSHTALLESVDVRLAWRPAGNDLFTAFPPTAHSNYTPDDVPSGLPFATIDEAIAAAPAGGTPLEASPVPVLLLPAPAREDHTLGASTLFKLCSEVIAPCEKNDQPAQALRDHADAQSQHLRRRHARAFQQLRQETQGEKRFACRC